MDDGDIPLVPRPKGPPPAGQPLPRMWKSEPEPEADLPGERKSRKERLAEEKEAAARAAGKDEPKPQQKGGAKRSGKKEEGKKPKGALIEATPEMDTYEARQRTRLMISVAIGAAFLGVVIFIYNSLSGPRDDMDQPGPDEGKLAAPTGAPKPPGGEQEAKNRLDTARQVAKNGKTKEAIAILTGISTTYPKTEAAKLAKQALDRPSKNLPLFLDESAVVASSGGAEKSKAAEVSPEVTINATAPTRVRPGANGEAQLNLPSNAPESARTGRPTGPVTSTASGRALPAGFTARAEAGVHASGWPNQINSDRDGATMFLIPGGTFPQGRNDGPLEEQPEHKVALGTFYVDEHEVTFRQFALFQKETGVKVSATKNEELPMTNVSQREAIAYCDWAGKKLPTEAQWEASARTTDGRLYPWGSVAPVWSKPRQSQQIDPVMSFELDQSPYGPFDLAGNAWEWTRDLFDPGYYKTLRSGVAHNPTGPASLKSRLTLNVVRGCSKTWSASARVGLKPETKLPYVGFRGILAVDEGSGPEMPAAPAPTGGTPGSTPQPKQGQVIPF
jgi:formylglycine-generating enzyme